MLTILLFIGAVYYHFLPTLEKSMMESKRENVQDVTQLAWSILSFCHQQEITGTLNREEAQKEAIQLVRDLRYGPEGKDYFWINDLTPRMIVHPYRSDLDGQDLSQFTDPQGKRLFIDMVETVQQSESGFVRYIWQWKDDASRLLPKESFVHIFSPWNWIVGTGMYLSDIQTEIREVKRNFLIVAIVILILIVGLHGWMIHQQIQSERKRGTAEAQIRHEQQKILDIIEFLPDATFVIDRDQRVIAWNRAIETMTGVKKEEILGKGDYAYAIPFYGYARPILIDFIMEKKKSISDEYRHFMERNGIYYGEAYVPHLIQGSAGYVTITASPLVNENGSIVGAIESIRDVTEHKKAEEALRASEVNYRSIFNGANEAIFIHDPETGAVIDVNQKAVEMYGYSLEEFRSAPLDIVTSGESPHIYENALNYLHQAAKGNAQLFEWRSRHKNGHLFWIEVNLKQVLINGQNRIMAVVRDIDQRKKDEEEKYHLEEQLRQSQKMEAIGKLAGGVAHDFNNLLTVIQGYSDLALQNIDPSIPTHKHLEEVKKAAGRAEAITHQLLAFSRRQIIQPQNLDLNAIIVNLGIMLRRLIGEDIELRTILSPDLGTVRADKNQIEQVIINLAVNARDAMPRGGKLSIETGNVILDSKYAMQHVAVWPGKYVMLAIGDNGCGMSKDIQSRIFEPFFTTKGKGEGTGLGLSMVYGIVKQNAGNIFVYSELGKGTVFKIYLPQVQDDYRLMESEEKETPVPRGTETILLVEDERSVLSLGQQILGDLGYTVLPAASAVEARKQFHSYPNSIDLLLTDVIMPYESGRELADSLLAIHPTLKVLFMSGYTDDAIVHHGVLEPGIAFLQKPYTPSKLGIKVRSVLDS